MCMKKKSSGVAVSVITVTFDAQVDSINMQIAFSGSILTIISSTN